MMMRMMMMIVMMIGESVRGYLFKTQGHRQFLKKKKEIVFLLLCIMCALNY